MTHGHLTYTWRDPTGDLQGCEQCESDAQKKEAKNVKKTTIPVGHTIDAVIRVRAAARRARVIFLTIMFTQTISKIKTNQLMSAIYVSFRVSPT
jgi:hypothetical protein